METNTLNEVNQMQTCIVPPGAGDSVDENFRQFTARAYAQLQLIKTNKQQQDIKHQSELN